MDDEENYLFRLFIYFFLNFTTVDVICRQDLFEEGNFHMGEIVSVLDS